MARDDAIYYKKLAAWLEALGSILTSAGWAVVAATLALIVERKQSQWDLLAWTFVLIAIGAIVTAVARVITISADAKLADTSPPDASSAGRTHKISLSMRHFKS